MCDFIGPGFGSIPSRSRRSPRRPAASASRRESDGRETGCNRCRGVGRREERSAGCRRGLGRAGRVGPGFGSTHSMRSLSPRRSAALSSKKEEGGRTRGPLAVSSQLNSVSEPSLPRASVPASPVPMLSTLRVPLSPLRVEGCPLAPPSRLPSFAALLRS